MASNFILGLTALLAAPKLVSAQTSCSDLVAEVGSGAQIQIASSATVVATGLNISSLGKSTNTKSICRIQASIPYGLNHTLGVELWLPENWNGRYISVGNGGLAGYIDYVSMLDQVNKGYATAAGDGGHLLVNNGNGTTASGQAIPFLDDIQQTVMWIHDSIATFTPPLRQLTERYYGKPASYSYYIGCSTGGAQGFALAQWHPHLFDGIIAGCPGNFYSHLILGFLFNYNQAHSQPNNASFLQQDVLNFMTNATLDACDELDGLKDRLIENPLACTFNISSLLCVNGQSSTNDGKVQCLTQAQIETAQAIYSGPRANSTQVYPGFDFGSESSWMLQQSILATAYSYPILQNLVFKDLKYDPSTFNFNTDVAKVNMTASPYINSISPDLSAYKARGGKLLVYQGWADEYNAGTWPIVHLNMIDSFLQSSGLGRAEEFMRLFMAPGVGHCQGAPAYPYVPGNLHTLETMVEWVENGGQAIEMLSDKPVNGKNVTRKLCAWPRTAKVMEGRNGTKFADFECIDS